MKIAVLNGSPKGELSFTMQYVSFIQKKFPQHEFKVFHIARSIAKFEKDESSFNAVIKEIREADGVLWGFGVWVLAVSAQMIRFIELISERSVQDAFKNKYTAALSTSIHYFDNIAHNYIRSVAEDLEMNYFDHLSFDLMDIRKKEIRENMIVFTDNFIDSIQNKNQTSKLYYPLLNSDFKYSSSSVQDKINPGDKSILVLKESSEYGSNLDNMVNRFIQSFSSEENIKVVELNDVYMRGACLGCMRCGYDYNCQYNDGFSEFYNNQVRSADIIIFAATVKGRFLSSQWKTFYDRAFFWNHTPSLLGKQIGYIISGSLSQNHNLIEYLEASVVARQESNLVDIITDEIGDSAKIDRLLQYFAERVVEFSEKEYIKPKNFLGVGGHKIFRDDIWGRLRMIWQADYRFYKKHGMYDFPQKQYGMRVVMSIMMLLTKIPGFRKKFYNNLNKMPVKRMQGLIKKY